MIQLVNYCFDFVAFEFNPVTSQLFFVKAVQLSDVVLPQLGFIITLVWQQLKYTVAHLYNIKYVPGGSTLEKG